MFIIKRKGKFWAMTFTGEPNRFGNPADIDQLVEFAVTDLAEDTRARRMSYDTWYWRDRQDMDAWVTYFRLKYMS